MKSCCLLWTLIYGAIVLKVNAQDQRIRKTPLFNQKPSFNIKLSPLNMLETFYHTLEGAIEYKFHPKYAMQFQFGYGNSDITLYNNYYNEIEESEFETYRARVEFRKYVDSHFLQRSWILDPNGAHFPYWAIELMWRNTTFYDYDFVGRDCLNGFCAYQEIDFFRRIKNTGVAYFKLGNQHFFWRNFFVDYYLGIGLRFVHVAAPDENTEAFSGNEVFIDPREPKQLWLPGIALGLKIGYSLSLKR